jgi:signal transduction histidine kinase
MVIACVLLAHGAMAGESRTVLVLYSGNRLVPGNVAADRGLRETLSKLDDRPVQVFSEFLDRPDFGGEAYEQTESRYLREKYAARPPAVVVAVSDNALEFLLGKRAELFPSVPLVHVAVTKTSLALLLPLPPDVVGVPLEYDFAKTIEQALRWHPRAKRLIVVTGASDRDREWEARLRRDVPRVASNIDVEYLAGLPVAALQQRLGQLGADAVVFTPGFYQDGAGRLFNPRDAARLIAEASTAPVYGSFDTFIGTGVVGGWMPSFEATGRQAAEVVNAIFSGVTPASVRLPKAEPAALRVDWRQVRRWGIDEATVPADTVVSFRQPTFWEMYRGEAILVAVIFLLQMALIVALLVERRRRRTAQLAVQKQRTELAHASRLAVAGELTASIAHEINQPLGAILTNADAAELLLQSGADRLDDVRRILGRIRADDLRASQVIRRLRTLLAKQEFERRPIRLAETLADVAELLRTEARQRRITLEWPTAVPAAEIVGDSVQIQQVIINLVLNAMDAVAELPEAARVVTVTVAQAAGGVVVTVRDQGPGVGAENIGKLFESFFTTKARGMGLGLSIARTIVEAHGGRIWADDGLQEGAQFHVQLPVLPPSLVT